MTLRPRFLSPSRVPLVQVLKTSVATALAWLVVTPFATQLPIFAAIAALLVVQPSVNQSLGKAVERSLGVIVGVLVGFGVGAVFGRQSWLVLLAILVAILVAWVFRLAPGSSTQIPISAMLVLAIGEATPEYSLERILETLVGAIIGIIVNALIVPPVVVGPAATAVRTLAERVSSAADGLADALTQPPDAVSLEILLRDARALRPLQRAATAALDAGAESLLLNPRRSKHRALLEECAASAERLAPLVTQLLGMTRAVHDHYSAELRTDPTVQGIARELHRVAHDVTLLAPGTAPRDDRVSPAPALGPVLTEPLRVARPDPDHWVLVGALLEDLRRIRRNLVGE